MSAPALEARGLMRRFGGLVATDNVSFAIEPGARQALIGPNGAGKTTLINLLTGVLKPSAGQVLLQGEDVTQLSANQRVRRGLARTFQINQLFPDLTPVESLALAISERRSHGADVWRVAGGRADIIGEIEDLLRRLACSPIAIARRACCPMANGVCWRSRWRSPAVRACYCSTSRRRACRRKSAATFSPRSPLCPRTSRSC